MSHSWLRSMAASALCLPLIATGQTGEPATTIRTNTNLVVVDVVVSDTHHNPVHGLKASDFSLLEDNHEQTLKNFEEHSSTTPVHPITLPKMEPGVYTNYTPAPDNGALNVLLLDTLNTPMKDQPTVRDEVLKYLKEAPSGTRLAIFGLNMQLHLLQGFTSDPEVLRAAINSKKAAAKGSPLFDNAMTGDAEGADNPALEMATDALGNSPDSAGILANLQQFMAEQQSFQFQMRARYTLDAFDQLGRYLSRLPGRKNVIWFSGAFPFNISPDPDLQNPFGVMASAEDEFRQTVSLLARSQVAVYPIDARGLMVAPMYDASNSGRKYARPGSPNAFSKDLQKFDQRTEAEHSTMDQMAEATGGRSFVNTNGLKEAVAKAIEAGSNYYTLTYSPTNSVWKGDYRKIQVKLAEQGLTLSYRRGYYADDPQAPVHHGEPNLTTKDAVPYNPGRTAMMRGGPTPSEILFDVRVAPSASTVEPDLAPGNQGNPKLKGPYRRFTVFYAVRTNDLQCNATPDGAHHCSVAFLAFVYDADGVLLNQQTNGFKASFNAERYAVLLRTGITYRQEVSVPVRGESFLRIGVQDLETQRVGALELPVAAVARLKPLAQQIPAAAPVAK